MARFTSKKYRQLVVKFGLLGNVKFDKGEVEVTDKEVTERLVDFAERHPEYGIEQTEADEKPLTPKQRAVAKATELGLDTSGTQADIEARIAAFEADADEDEDPETDDEDDETEDETDEDADDDDSDDDTSDEA